MIYQLVGSKIFSFLITSLKFLTNRVTGCFVLKKKEEYIPCVISAHELAESAAELAQTARNIEKINDSILRDPHDRFGKILKKTSLYEDLSLI